jgi:hypothetical protein
MLMTKTFIWIIAILVAFVGIIAATEVPISGALIIIAAYLITPISPLRKWSARIAMLYQESSHVFLLKTLVYLLPVLLLAAGFTGISRHTTPISDTTQSNQSDNNITAPAPLVIPDNKTQAQPDTTSTIQRP